VGRVTGGWELQMSALTDDFQRVRAAVGPQSYVVKDNEVIYSGALTATDSNGELLAATNTAGLKFAGVNFGPRVDNSDDGLSCVVDKSMRFRVACSGMAAGDVGKRVFVADDNTVALTGAVYVGRIVAVYSATEVLVDPTVGDDDVLTEPFEIADPAADTTNNGAATAAIPAAEASTNGAVAAVTFTAAPTPGSSQAAIDALSYSAQATQAEVQALEDEVAKIGVDVRAAITVQGTHKTELETQRAALELVGDDARAARTSAAATAAELELVGDNYRALRTLVGTLITGLKAQGLAVDA
jgi:hypothetical protein